jgi:phosphoglycolate phosphatase
MSHTTSTIYHGVLFDLDGTLIDTAEDFILCLNDLRHDNHLAALPADDIRKVVSDGARAMIKLGFDITESHPDFEGIKQAFLDLYLNNIARKSQLFSGLDETLHWCETNQIPWGVVTNKPRLYSEALLSALKLNDRISTLVCPDDVTHTKPDPEPLYKACNDIQLPPEQCLYVGDHVRDIEAGKRANMPTIAAAYGYVHSADEAQSWQANWCVESSEQLNSLLQTLLCKQTGKPSPQAAKNQNFRK